LPGPGRFVFDLSTYLTGKRRRKRNVLFAERDHEINTSRFSARYILALSYAMLGCCVSPSFLARTSHVNVSATSLALVCVDPEDPDETRRECLLRRLNRCMKLAEDMGLAVGNLQPALLLSTKLSVGFSKSCTRASLTLQLPERSFFSLTRQLSQIKLSRYQINAVFVNLILCLALRAFVVLPLSFKITGLCVRLRHCRDPH